MSRVLFCLSCLVLMGQVPLAAAQQELAALTFVQSCQEALEPSESQAGATVCQAFLQGYFAGSDEITRYDERLSPFKERALRSRVANRAMVIEKLPGRYCLPQGFSLDDVISSVLRQDPPVTASAAALVERVLETEFRCQ